VFTINCKEIAQKEDGRNIVMKTNLKRENFESNLDGQAAQFYVLHNKNGFEATFSNYGQRLLSLMVPDREGKFKDIVLGFETLQRYQEARERYFGAFVGRYANRISQGTFSVAGKKYTLATNNGVNHLHGGNVGFGDMFWEGRKLANNELEFTGISPHMDQGYPGNLEVRVNYLLTDQNELVISYQANTDRPTIVNLTHHSFFNLAGEGSGSVEGHLLKINADRYTPIDGTMIPTGELRSVEGTPFDFRTAKPIGRDLGADHHQLQIGKGYDHNFVLNKEISAGDGLTLAARVLEPTSGRMMEVLTDEPGLQFYSGNFLDGGTIGKSGKPYGHRGAFCLETQHFPDSPNQEGFPTTLLEPGQEYRSTCVYRFTTDQGDLQTN
jgi:aldose 1-epimerase